MKPRFKTKKIRVGDVAVGGGAPISIQSMTNTPTKDVAKTADQIDSLRRAGCGIVRIAVPDMASAGAVRELKRRAGIPLVADIHFDHRLALEAMKNGIDGLRLNPGNIRDPENVKKVVTMAKALKIPIRIGVNAGSIDRKKFGRPTAGALVRSCLEHVRILEKLGFGLIKISLKSSDVPTTIEAYRLMARERNYPLHIGITEAGTLFSGSIKSGVGLGILLWEGLGDTLRVSLSADPVREVLAGRQILRDLGLKKEGVEIVSCPTCARTSIDVEKIARVIEEESAGIRKPLKVAIMGCVVNGPGEAMDADLGIAGGAHEALLFKKGKIVRKVPAKRIASVLLEEIEKFR